MPTLTGTTASGFTRPSDPIQAVDLQNAISTAIGKTVTIDVTPTDLLVTGATLVTGDLTNIQTAISAYFYAYLQYAMPASDNPDMSGNRHNTSISEHAAYTSDSTVAATVGKLQTSAGIVYGAWPYPFTATTNSSGVATVYLTNDGTSTGTAAFSTIYQQSVAPVGVGTGNYNNTSIVFSGTGNKIMTITVNQITTVLGLLTASTTASAGVVIQGTVWGK